MIHPFHQCRTCDFQRTLAWFAGAVLLLVGVGAPFYFIERAERAREKAEAERREKEEFERRLQESRLKELEEDLRRQPPAAGRIGGPRTSNPFARTGQPPAPARNPYEYLPAEQQRMLRNLQTGAAQPSPSGTRRPQ